MASGGLIASSGSTTLWPPAACSGATRPRRSRHRRCRSRTSGAAHAPLQAGGIPVWFGGGATERTARRIATLGNGWLPIAGTPVDEVASGIALMAEESAAGGSRPRGGRVRAGLAGVKGPDGRPDVARTLEAASELVDLGVTGVSIALGRFVPRPTTWPGSSTTLEPRVRYGLSAASRPATTSPATATRSSVCVVSTGTVSRETVIWSSAYGRRRSGRRRSRAVLHPPTARAESPHP